MKLKDLIPTDFEGALLRFLCLLLFVIFAGITVTTDKIYIGIIFFILSIVFGLLTVFGSHLWRKS